MEISSVSVVVDYLLQNGGKSFPLSSFEVKQTLFVHCLQKVASLEVVQTQVALSLTQVFQAVHSVYLLPE